MSQEQKIVFHVFTNSQNARLYALTFDREGSQLPTDQGRWLYWKEFEAGLEARIGFGLEDEKAVAAEIERQGYYIWAGERVLKPAS